MFEKSSKINHSAEFRNFSVQEDPHTPLCPSQISDDLSQPVSFLERKSHNDEFLL